MSKKPDMNEWREMREVPRAIDDGRRVLAIDSTCTINCENEYVATTVMRLWNMAREHGGPDEVGRKLSEYPKLNQSYDELAAAIESHNAKNNATPMASRPKNAIEGLRVLADWFDFVYEDAGTGRDTVQIDLRRWADEVEQKLKVYNKLDECLQEIKPTWDKYGYTEQFMSAVLTPAFNELIEDMFKLFNTPAARLTVGDLQPGEKFKPNPDDEIKSDKHVLRQTCSKTNYNHISTINIPQGELLVENLYSGLIYLMAKSTPCEIVLDDIPVKAKGKMKEKIENLHNRVAEDEK
jgi:hypothetical protein